MPLRCPFSSQELLQAGCSALRARMRQQVAAREMVHLVWTAAVLKVGVHKCWRHRTNRGSWYKVACGQLQLLPPGLACVLELYMLAVLVPAARQLTQSR